MILLQEHFVIDVDVWGYDCEVRLNGYGVHTPWRGPYRGALSVNHWVIPGENSLEIAVQGVESDLPEVADSIEGENADGDEAEEPKPTRWVRACMVLERDVEQGTIVGEGDGEILADIGLSYLTVEEDDLPGVMRTTFECAATWPNWRWQEAKAFEEVLSDADTAEFAAFVDHLRQCIGRRDIDALMKHFAPTMAERAQAFEQDPDELTNAVRAEYAALFADPAFSLATNALTDLLPHLHCGHRVIEVTDKGGKPFIRHAMSGHVDGDWNMPLFVGVSDGSWSVLSV